VNPPDTDATGDFVTPADSKSSRIGESEDPRVTRALEEYLAAVRSGRRPERRAFLAGHADIAEELADCMEGLEFIQSAAPHLQRHVNEVPDSLPANPLGDYRIVRELGRGGMGVVYEAVQLSLGRRVALKVLPFAAALDQRQMQRFRNEAMAAAHLSHPHIVPVYAVGCERGVHYYAMQLVEGQPLTALIAGLREGHGATTGPAAPAAEAGAETAPAAAAGLSTERSHRSPAFVRAAARLGVQAAEALEHAHQTGVVHRDIKPANVLVDARGHLWVTDFGLAQIRGGADLTLTGDLVGTLRYMSPEQALAKHDLVDHRADVYALGAMLYELLTLRPACDGRDREIVLRQVLSEDPPRPRRLNPAVPADLETVVLTALAKEPDGRYPTAQALADDLRRVLDDRPITARRPGLARRAAKWARRHRPAVAAAAVAALLGVVALAAGLAAAAVWWAEAARQRDFARRAVDDMYTQVAERLLDQEPELEEVQREFLVKALQYYTEFAGEEANDPPTRRATAEAYRRVADIQQRLGAHREAERAYAAAIDRFERLGDRASLAASLHSLGVALWQMKAPPSEAEPALRRAVELREHLLAENPSDADFRAALGASVVDLGRYLQATGRHEDAWGAYNRAVDLLTGPAAPLGAADQSRLAAALAALAGLQNRDRAAETRQLLEQAIERQRAALAARPRHPRYRAALAAQLAALGRTLSQLRDDARAEAAYREAANMLDRLVDDFPRTPHFSDEAARRLVDLGDLLRAAGRAHEAHDAYVRAAARWTTLMDEYPTWPGYARDLAWVLATCPDPTVRDVRRAVAAAERAVAQGPLGGGCWRALGAARVRAGDAPGAIAALTKAVALGGGDGQDWLLLALAHAHRGDVEDARAWFDRARKWVADHHPDDATLRGLQSEVEALLAPPVRRTE
jgi:serine/threonine protein kinase